ncbi:MAG: twin-arginine translocase TatA/TatE family subunit [Planctomycetota bacterium]
MLDALAFSGGHHFLLMWSPGLPEIIIIGVVAVLLFGKRIPEVARSMGRGITEFKRGIKDEPDENNRDKIEESKAREKDTAVKS